ncbi:hypothetical protein TNCV_2981641 [Trichonephila clavipes]|nr:hypothetical protein TNCV_2981641 [Trichonephila clavipes]
MKFCQQRKSRPEFCLLIPTIATQKRKENLLSLLFLPSRVRILGSRIATFRIFSHHKSWEALNSVFQRDRASYDLENRTIRIRSSFGGITNSWSHISLPMPI